MDKTRNNRAWLLILPMTLLVAFSAIVPLMTVVNYSVQDILGPNTKVYVGFEWFRKVLRDPDLHAAFLRQLLFSFSVLAIELPLGLGVSLVMPRRGWAISASLVVLALPLLIPWNVVGTIWQIFGRTDIGMGGAALSALGVDYNYTIDRVDAWLTVLVMDVWHWTPLV
ncbi:MAG: carbohydrate ABC transporter permease, partial [bacterium]